MSKGALRTTRNWGLCVGLGLLAAGVAACSSDNGGSPGSGSPDGSTSPDATTPLDSSAPDSASPRDGATSAGDASDAVAPGDGGAPDTGIVEANIVIADQYNNRVIEIDPTGRIVWSFGDGKAVPGPTSVVAPNDAERLRNGQTLISGTGDPGAAGPACAALDAGGCADNRVLLVNQDGGLAWTYTDLSAPVCARVLANGDVLVTDQGNNRIIEVAPDAGPTAAPLWSYGPTTDAGPFLNGPNSAERTASGTTVIADEGNGRVVEVAQDGGLVWQYALPTNDAGESPEVAYASRLPNGDTLITDSTDDLILEVAPDGGVVWQYHDVGDAGPTGPTRAVRLASGHTLISNQTDGRVFEIDNAVPPKVVASYLTLPGDGGTLNGPYDAKRVGDYTGVSAPPAQ